MKHYLEPVSAVLSFCKSGTACCAACSIDRYIGGMASSVLVVYTFCCRTCDFQFFIRCSTCRTVFCAFWCVGNTACFIGCLGVWAVYFDIWFATHISLMMHTGENTTFQICHNNLPSFRVLLLWTDFSG